MSHNDVTSVKVVVPPQLPPDRRILVQLSDGRQFSAVVPDECPTGSTMLVRIPPQAIERHPQSQSHQPQHTPPQTNRVQTIKVPVGKRKKGEKFRVRLPDGRTIMATVPFNGCKEFSLDTSTQTKKERQQNWHDNPLAVAPMILGPMMM